MIALALACTTLVLIVKFIRNVTAFEPLVYKGEYA